MINKNHTYAIIGASNDKDKFGYKVLKDLKESGYKVIPVNLKEDKILDLKSYKKLSDIKEQVDVVIFIIPPQITIKVLEEVKELNIKNVWMQPGSESKTAIEFCKKNQINCSYNKCIMIERLKK